jgi:hypothetical protein
MSNSSLTVYIKKDRGGCRVQNVLGPSFVIVAESKLLHHLEDGHMFDCIKCVCEIQFEDNYVSFGVVALMDVLKCPSQTVLYCSRFDDSILI